MKQTFKVIALLSGWHRGVAMGWMVEFNTFDHVTYWLAGNLKLRSPYCTIAINSDVTGHRPLSGPTTIIQKYHAR
jgi:hypothetical protein